MALLVWRSRRRWQPVLDITVGFWVLAWMVVGGFVGHDIYQLGRFGDTLLVSADALEETAEGLETVEGVPFVGERIGRIADEVRTTAESVRDDAVEAQEGIGRLSYLLGVAIAVIPSVPVLGLYLPARIRRFRERREVRQALSDSAFPDRVRRYLAYRALTNLPYHVLREVSETPWRDLEEGRYDALARSELERLGLDGEPSLIREGVP